MQATPPIQVRPEQVSDYSAITQILIQAFGQPEEARLVEKIRSSPAYIPELALVAEVDHEVVGHILFSYGQLLELPTLPVLVLAPLAVLPSKQRQGVGKRLVQEGLALVRTRGNALVTVLGHPDYYAQFGFEPASRYGIQHPFEVPEAAFRVKRIGQLPEKLNGQLRYAPAFDEVT